MTAWGVNLTTRLKNVIEILKYELLAIVVKDFEFFEKTGGQVNRIR